MIALDTDICVEFLRGNGHVIRRIEKHGLQDLFVPAMSAAELMYGAEKSKTPDRNRERVEAFLSMVGVAYSDENTVRTFGYVKAYLAKAGLVIPDADLMIASSALSRNAVLATGNVRHFNRIWGLRVEDWFD